MESMRQNGGEPYAALGARIKHLREQWQQSPSEVSGTLEIDESILRSIEAGRTMPGDEILDMLISHFLLTEEQAQDLRDLADQFQEQVGDALSSGIEDMLMKQIVMYLPIDSKTVYTDSMNATVNNHGVVLQFMQSTGPEGQQFPVSKVGMSRAHAEKLIEVLRNTLDQHDRSNNQKRLSSPDSN
jgi:hypothetical protein